MAEPNESGPIFVDVAGTQEQFPMQQEPFVVFTHNMSKNVDQTVKEETLDQEMQIAQNNIVDSSTLFEYPITEKQEVCTAPETKLNVQTKKTEEFTYPLEVNKRIKCTEKPNDIYSLPCFYTTNSEDRLIRHIRKVHRGENPFQCTMCDYSTYNKALFEEHVRIHQGIKPFKCRVCPYRSVSKKNTKKHEQIHRPDNPLKCPHCEFIARHERSLQLHLQMHNGHIECKTCGFKAKNPQMLKMHRNKEHPNNSVGNKYTCNVCKFEFIEVNSLNVHKRKARKCDECGITLCTKLIYDKHMISQHAIATQDKQFICAICKWSSSTKTRILLHLIHHPNQKVDENIVDITILRNFGIME